MSNDYYKILNINPSASPEEIQRAYRALAFRYHPDRNQSQVAATLMATINEAYEVLGEPRKRSIYDRGHVKKDRQVGDAILRAAREALLKKNWSVVEDLQTEFVLKNGSRQVHVGLVPTLNPSVFRDFQKRADAFCVLMVLQIERSFNLASETMAVIDVMYSRLYGTFPDNTYSELFQNFI